MARAWKPHSSAPAITEPAGVAMYRYWSIEPRTSFVHPSCIRYAALDSMVSRPTSRATYMYQRRSVAEAPSSPTAARSRDAITKWNPRRARDDACPNQLRRAQSVERQLIEDRLEQEEQREGQR